MVLSFDGELKTNLLISLFCNLAFMYVGKAEVFQFYSGFWTSKITTGSRSGF